MTKTCKTCKTCITCVYAKEEHGEMVCEYRSKKNIDPVTGLGELPRWTYCSLCREDGWIWTRVLWRGHDLCGKAGRHWEAKP